MNVVFVDTDSGTVLNGPIYAIDEEYIDDSASDSEIIIMAKKAGHRMQYGPVCPSCHDFIPSNYFPDAYPGAISRRDNATEICSFCGTREAVTGIRQTHTTPLTKEEWLKVMKEW